MSPGDSPEFRHCFTISCSTSNLPFAKRAISRWFTETTSADFRSRIFTTPFYTVKMASSGKKRAAHETESGDSVSDSPVIDVVKKKKKYFQKFKPQYKKDFPDILSSSKGAEFAFCTKCTLHFSISHGGQHDIKRHVNSESHKSHCASTSSPQITNFFTAAVTKDDAKGKLEDDITKAEATLFRVIGHCNMPMATADMLTQCVKFMFPDSKIATGMKCGRNKATAVIKAMAQDTKHSLRARMKRGPFTISTDGSNDSDSKLYPIVIRCVSDSGLVCSELLSIPVCDGPATGENIFKLLNKELMDSKVPWANCLSLGCDNAPVMTGHKKGVFAFIKEKQPQIFLSGCTLHMVHNGAKAAAAHLPPVATVLVDIFYYLDKGDRKERVKVLQSLYDVEQKKILKHVCTRWLSIGKCLERLLQNWDPLKEFFLDEKNALPKNSFGGIEKSYASTKVESIFDFIRSPTNKLFCLFLLHQIKVFDAFLVSFQSEKPMIHKLRRGMLKLMRSILTRFVKPSAMLYKSPETVDHNLPVNIKVNSELVIGEDAHQFLQEKEAHHLRVHRVEEFFTSAKKYFVSLLDYLKKWLPVNDPLLLHAEVADVGLQTVKADKPEVFPAEISMSVA